MLLSAQTVLLIQVACYILEEAGNSSNSTSYTLVWISSSSWLKEGEVHYSVMAEQDAQEDFSKLTLDAKLSHKVYQFVYLVCIIVGI